MNLALLYLGAYLLGSVPFAVIFGRMKGVDILKVGSGNPGMTNVSRALGSGWGIACFFLDVCKGLVPVLLARQLVKGPMHGIDAELIWFSTGVAAIVGHCASVFLKFKGGKGVSTALGAIIGTSPIVAALCFGLFLVIYVATRYVAVASVIGVGSALLFSPLMHDSPQLLPVFLVLSLFVAYRHRKNFVRLKNGTEPKFSFRKTSNKSDPAL
jgi:acyl phosphate:glycerol-3-phosphate acyltransferase